MKIRQARKIADRAHAANKRLVAMMYTEWTMHCAYMRLHREWRARRSVTVEEDGRRFFSITDDYRRASRLWGIAIGARHFIRGRYNPDSKYNERLRSIVRRTWSPPES